MICSPCRNQTHDKCNNPPTCTCQHRKTVRLPDGTIAPVREDGTVIVLQKAQSG